MKKIIIAIVAVFAMRTAVNAQFSGIGVRLGGGQGFGAELSTMWNFGNRTEIDLGWSSGDHHTNISLTGIYQWQGDIASGFGWFAGVGARLAMWSWDNDHNDGDTDFALGLAGQAGIEYQFSAVPIQVSLDIRPCFWLIPETDFHWGDIALGIRYMF